MRHSSLDKLSALQSKKFRLRGYYHKGNPLDRFIVDTISVNPNLEEPRKNQNQKWAQAQHPPVFRSTSSRNKCSLANCILASEQFCGNYNSCRRFAYNRESPSCRRDDDGKTS
eukprot:scaffold1169_cov120-Cylindrotheca_fusiformis.AAC.4